MPKDHRDPNELRAIVLLFLGCGVFVVWSIVVIGGFFLDRPVDGQVHVIMLSTVTGLIGGSALAERRGNDR